MNLFESFLPGWMPNIHPLLIHFPIVLLLLVVLVHLTAIIVWKLPWLRTMTLAVSISGFLSLILTYFSGRQAADSVSLPTVAMGTLSKHADLAFWTLIYFGILTIIHLSVRFFQIHNKKSLSIMLFVLGLVGLVLVVQTADLGGQLVYKYGVGVKSHELKESVERNEPGVTNSSFEIDENGSWILLPAENIELVFLNNLNWVEGSSNDIDVNLITNNDKEKILELKIKNKPVLFSAGYNKSSSQMDTEINLCGFQGTVSLLHHIQDKNNYDYFSVGDKQFRLGRMGNGVNQVFIEKSADHECWINLRVVADSRHFRGYLNDEILLHDHAKESPPSKNGLLIDGTGTIYIKTIEVQVL